jgi:ankyrin repeat protein
MTLQHGMVDSALEAALVSDLDIVKVLVEAGADVNMPLQNSGSALAAAIYRRNIGAVKYLVQEAGADVNMPLQNSKFDSALVAAAAAAEIDILKCIIGANVDVNQCFPNGKFGSALAAAAYFGRKDHAELLIDVGADVNLRLEGMSFSNALQAARADVSNKDLMLLKMEGKQEDSVKQDKGVVAELLEQHGASV